MATLLRILAVVAGTLVLVPLAAVAAVLYAVLRPAPRRHVDEARGAPAGDQPGDQYGDHPQ